MNALLMRPLEIKKFVNWIYEEIFEFSDTRMVVCFDVWLVT